MNTVPFYAFPFMNEVTIMVFASEMHAHSKHIPHLMVTFACTCHILSHIFTPFPVLPHPLGREGDRVGGRGRRRSHDFWSDPCVFI
jgi:hypothetical protein